MYSPLNKKRHSYAFTFLITALLLLIINIIVQLHSDFLWFDEAGQFYIGYGQNHYSPFGVGKGDINEVIINNRNYNADPGGFSIIVYFWTKISTNLYWLRILPISFFLAYLFSFFKIFLKITENRVHALYLTFIPLFVPPLISHAVELRAYTMEALGVVVSVLFLFSLEKKITLLKLLIFSLVICFFISSRYTLLIAISIQTLVVIKIIFFNNIEMKKKFIYLIAYCAPLVLSVLCIYIFSAQYHFGNFDGFYLPYIGHDPAILLKAHNILYLIILMFISIFYFYKYQVLEKSLKSLIQYTIGVNIILIILSILKLHPWSILNSRLNPPLILIIISMTWVLLKILKENSLKINLSEKYVNICILVLCCLHIFSLSISLKNNWRNQNIIRDFNKLKDESIIDISKIHIHADRYYYVSLKYLIEHGVLKNEKVFVPKNIKKIKTGLNAENKYSNKDLILPVGLNENFIKLSGYDYIYRFNDNHAK